MSGLKNYFMNSRSKKYYENRKSDKGHKKGSSSKAGYDEQNEKTFTQARYTLHGNVVIGKIQNL